MSQAEAVPSFDDLQSAFHHAPIGMAVLTPTGVIMLVNDRLAELLGREAAALPGSTFFDVTHPDDLALARHNCSLMAAGLGAIVRHECRFLRVDGSPVWVLVSTSRVEKTETRSSHLIMHVEDITDRKLLESRLVHEAKHDPLTGLGNRSLLRERISAAGDDPRQDSLLVLDLDGFKRVNDTYGHPVGDGLLRELASRLTRLLRPCDVAVRLGGDEFAVLCAGTDRTQADMVAERLRAAAATPFTVDGHVITLGAAVGVGTCDHRRTGDEAVPDAVLEDLMLQADRAMYEEKRRPRIS